MDVNKGINDDAVPAGSDVNASNLTGDEIVVDDTPVQQGTPVSDFDPKPWALKYRGTTVYPKDRDHLVNLAQKGYSYDTNLATLKKQEQALAEREAGITNLDEVRKLAEAFDANPQFKQFLMQKYQEILNGGGTEQKDGEDIVGKLKPTIESMVKPYLSEIEQYKESLAQGEADRGVSVEIEQLKQAYPRQNWSAKDEEGKTLMDRIIQYSLDTDLPTLKSAYRDYMFDTIQENTKADTLKQEAENTVKATKAGIVQDSGSQSSARGPRKVNVKDMSWNDAAKFALDSGILKD